MQVADVLGDKHDTVWLEKLAGKVLTTDWRSIEQWNTMICALLRLPPHLLHRVFCTCLFKKPICAFLTDIPAMLHPVAVSAAASSGSLTLDPRYNAAITILTHLPYCVLSNPGLQHLSVVPFSQDEFADAPPEHTDHTLLRHTPATASIIARAVSAHPSLTRFSVSGSRFEPQWLRAFSDCLAPGALPNLVCLSLCVDAHPGGCAALGTVLTLLPSVTQLTVTITINQSPEEASAALSLSAYTPLASTPANLPRLQKLTWIERSAVDDDLYSYPRRFGHDRRVSCADTFLPLLNAPALTRLGFTMCTARFSLDQLLSHATQAAFPALAEVEFKAALWADDLVRATTVAVAIGGSPSPPPPLTTITVDSLCAVSAVNIAAGIAELSPACLTSLTVSVSEDGSDFYDSDCTDADDSAGWCRLFAALSRCTHLQALHLRCLDGIPREQSEDYSGGLSTVLMQLRQLTCLELRAAKEYFSAMFRPTEGVVWLDGRTVGRGIAALTALESLWISHGEGTMQLGSGQYVLDACTGLRHLTQLGLCCHGAGLEQITEAIPKLPSLRHLILPKATYSGAGDGGSARFASQLGNVVVELVEQIPDDDIIRYA